MSNRDFFLYNQKTLNYYSAMTRSELETFFQSVRPQALRVAFRVLKNEEDAEDAVQNASLNTFLNISSFHGKSALRTWYIRIVINSSLMMYRKKRSDPIIAWIDDPGYIDRLISGERDPLSIIQSKQNCQIIRKEIEKLSPKLRDSMLGFLTNGRAEHGSKDKMDGTTKARLFRARKALQKKFQNKAGQSKSLNLI